MMDDVTFGPLSKWQKTDCINNSADNTCTNLATQEATLHDGSWSIGIRCCDEPACMERAKVLAIASVKPSGGWKPPAY